MNGSASTASASVDAYENRKSLRQEELDGRQLATCDRCGGNISGERFKCDDCPDFDYCHVCVAEAAHIHPGHTFKNLGPIDSSAIPGSELAKDNVPDNSWPAGCTSCSTITRILPVAHLAFSVPPPPGSEVSVKRELRISKMVEASMKGCAFCSFMIEKLFVSGNMMSLSYSPEKSWYAEPLEHPKEREKAVSHCMELLKKIRNERVCFDVRPMHSENLPLPDFNRLHLGLYSTGEDFQHLKNIRLFSSMGKIEFDFDVYAAAGDPAAVTLSGRPPNTRPASDEGIAQIKQWIADCERKHGGLCSQSQVGSAVFHPTRLLDVSGSSHITIHETSNEPIGHYIALLSYPAGDQAAQLTRAILSKDNADFAVESLPQNFRDAVHVTRVLGISFLWIESLCIVQDDAHDQAWQAAHIPDIFKHAYITIDAASANSVEAGFLQDNSDGKTGLWKGLIPFAYPVPSNDASSFASALELPPSLEGKIWLMDELRDMSRPFETPGKTPASRFQQRMLSTRLLSYGRWPTWRCRGMVDSDGGYYRQDLKGRLDDRLPRLLVASGISTLPQASDLFRTHQLYQSWCNLVNDYTKCMFNRPADRLTAIGGLAAEVSKVFNSAYYAGLWGNNLLHSTMWFASTREWLTRAETWTAPTWSWASVESPVTYEHVTDDATPLARVLSCDVDLLDAAAPFGNIKRGRLAIQGPFHELDHSNVVQLLKKQDRPRPPPRNNDVAQWYRQIFEYGSNIPEADYNGMTTDEAIETLPEPVYGLITFSRDWVTINEETEQRICYSGLLLRSKGDENGHYERIGAFMNATAEWLDQTRQPWATKQVVVI